VRVKRRAQLLRPPEHGQDHHPTRGQPLVQPRRGGDPVKPRQVDVEHREVGTLRRRRGHDVGAGQGKQPGRDQHTDEYHATRMTAIEARCHVHDGLPLTQG
jgi:hypothetical protein